MAIITILSDFGGQGVDRGIREEPGRAKIGNDEPEGEGEAMHSHEEPMEPWRVLLRRGAD